MKWHVTEPRLRRREHRWTQIDTFDRVPPAQLGQVSAGAASHVEEGSRVGVCLLDDAVQLRRLCGVVLDSGPDVQKVVDLSALVVHEGIMRYRRTFFRLVPPKPGGMLSRAEGAQARATRRFRPARRE